MLALALSTLCMGMSGFTILSSPLCPYLPKAVSQICSGTLPQELRGSSNATHSMPLIPHP